MKTIRIRLTDEEHDKFIRLSLVTIPLRLLGDLHAKTNLERAATTFFQAKLSDYADPAQNQSGQSGQ